MLRCFMSLIYLVGGLALFAMPNPTQAQIFSVGFPSPLQDPLSPRERLGRELFNDMNLSTPAGLQGCVSCHDPSVGFTSPDPIVNAFGGPHFGAIEERFGPRKPPSAAYAFIGNEGKETPSFKFREDRAGGVNWHGGVFWDGRAKGFLPLNPDYGPTILDPLAEQALFPFLNPVEQNVPDTAPGTPEASELSVERKRTVVRKVAFSNYRRLFQQVWGRYSLNYQNDHVVERAYDQIVVSIAAFERSSEMNPFSSKFDAWLEGKVDLTPQEKLGLWVFELPQGNVPPEQEMASLLTPEDLEALAPYADRRGKGRCNTCHTSIIGGEYPPTFSDFNFHNLGVPKNLDNPFYNMPPEINPDGANFIDIGLGQTLMDLEVNGGPPAFLNWAPTPPGGGPPIFTWQQEVSNALGRFKTPTLRNVNLRPSPDFPKSYMHNGVFKSMEEVVRFYNKRDVEFPVAEYPDTQTPGFIAGDLGMTDEEEAAIVAFMATLSDGYEVPIFDVDLDPDFDVDFDVNFDVGF